MAAILCSPVEVASFRDELRRNGIVISSAMAGTLLRKVGSRGVALDAMLMPQRPIWLAELIEGQKK